MGHWLKPKFAHYWAKTDTDSLQPTTDNQEPQTTTDSDTRQSVVHSTTDNRQPTENNYHRQSQKTPNNNTRQPTTQQPTTNNRHWQTQQTTNKNTRQQRQTTDRWQKASENMGQGIDSASHGRPVRQKGLSYWPARLQKLAESIPWNWVLGFLNVYK